jgi:hypothetical protein
LIANGQTTVLRPFSDVPREVLITARDRLVELGGSPPKARGVIWGSIRNYKKNWCLSFYAPRF